MLAWGYLWSSCVDEYKLPTEISKKFEAEVVIQGRILSNEESIIYVSYTSAFNQETAAPIVRDAQVTIIGQDGYRSELAEYKPENNCYVINTGNLSTGTQYAIEVELDGETYQSEYLSLTETPDIDEITHQEHEDGISIHVTTLAEETDSRHYMSLTNQKKQQLRVSVEQLFQHVDRLQYRKIGQMKAIIIVDDSQATVTLRPTHGKQMHRFVIHTEQQTNAGSLIGFQESTTLRQ